MKNPGNITFDDLADGGTALLISGLAGALIGVITGMSCGVFFFLVGSLYGAIWGGPIGFCAAVLGVAAGGRAGCRIGGVLFGAIGACSLLGSLGRGAHPSVQSILSTGWFGLLILVMCITVGYLAGLSADQGLARVPLQTGLFGRLATIIDRTRLRGMTLPMRLALAAIQLAPMLLFLWRLTLAASQLWID